MKKFLAGIMMVLMTVMYGCGGDGGGSSSPTPTPTPTPTTAPTAPTGVTTTPGNNQAIIAWTAVSGATSYNIYWSTTAGVTSANGTKITGASNPYTQASLTNGTTYYYVVTAVNSIGESAASAQVSATPTTTVPLQFTTAMISGQTYTLYADPAANISFNEKIKFYTDGSVGAPGSTTTVGTWTINQLGKLVVTVYSGNVRTFTYTSTTNSVITASVVLTNATHPAYNAGPATITFTP